MSSVFSSRKSRTKSSLVLYEASVPNEHECAESKVDEIKPVGATITNPLMSSMTARSNVTIIEIGDVEPEQIVLGVKTTINPLRNTTKKN